MARAWAFAKRLRLPERRYLILAHDHFVEDAKTAHGVIRYAADPTVAVVDASCAGSTVRQVLPSLHSDAPIVGSLNEGLPYRPSALLIGTAPQGGKLPPHWRNEILVALNAGIDVVNGLHDMLRDDPELAAEAHKSGATIWDVREPPSVPLFSGRVYDVAAPVLLAVGNDCAVGKMSVMLELSRAAARQGSVAEFVPTGQTGIMIAGWGIAVDRVIADFATGAAEQLVLEAARRQPACILVEGQGGINNPAYAPVTLALLFGSAPDALILVADIGKTHVEGFQTPILDLPALIEVHEMLCGTVKPAKVIAVALNTRSLDDAQARQAVRDVREETGLPADDVVRFGAGALWSALQPSLVKRAPLDAGARA